eukprot:6200276-Amphidinium_carterae.1
MATLGSRNAARNDCPINSQSLFPFYGPSPVHQASGFGRKVSPKSAEKGRLYVDKKATVARNTLRIMKTAHISRNFDAT